VYEKGKVLFAGVKRKYRTNKEIMKAMLKDKYINERVQSIKMVKK